MELHLHSGDFARDVAASVLAGCHLVYADVLLEGPVPGLDEGFSAVRGGVLGEFLGTDIRGCADRLQAQIEAVRGGLSQADSVWLWFDDCLYDQLLLHFVIRWFLSDCCLPTYLVRCPSGVSGFGCLDAGMFRALQDEARRLSPEALRWSHEVAYPALFSDSPRGWESLCGCVHPEFPATASAARRLLEQLPSSVSGFDRLENALVQGVLNGYNEFERLFAHVSSQESLPFFSDDYVRRVLFRLSSSSSPMVRLRGELVTGTLQSMRSLWGWGEWRSLHPVRRHVVNVCLEGVSECWRWDRRSGCCMRLSDGQ